MQRIKRWLTSKRLLMAQLHDMQRQLQEAWDRCDELITDRALMAQDVDYTRIQLRRLSRERFQERELRMAAEELRDTYLEQLENEEE